MHETLAQAISAMDRLNSFARTGNGDAMKYHIYRMKSRAIDAADGIGALTTRIVFAVVDCGACSGTGYWRGGYHKCRRCDDGKGRLHFRETVRGRTLTCQDWPLDDIRWHTPISGTPPAEAVEANGWKPRTPGREMTPDEVAEAMNIAEPVFAGPFPYYYRFHLGDAGKLCAFCAAECPPLETTLAIRGQLSWCQAVCEECAGHFRVLRNTYGGDLKRDRMPLPTSLITPNIQAWIDRQGGRKC